MERRRESELDGRVSSSARSSTCDSLLATPRDSLFLDGPALLLSPADRAGLVPSLLPGRNARAELLREGRGCRWLSRPSK